MLDALAARPGAPTPPARKVQRWTLERSVLRLATRLAAPRASLAIFPVADAPEAADPWDPNVASSRARAAAVLAAYAEDLPKLAAALSAPDAAPPPGDDAFMKTARDVSRRADGLRLALSPKAVAAAYASDLRDGHGAADGPSVFRDATRGFASCLGAARSAWAPSATAETKLALLRVGRACLCALAALCPPKAWVCGSGRNGVGGRRRDTAEALEAFRRLEFVSAAATAPLGLVLDRAAFGPDDDPAARTSLRGPFACLLYTLSWHEDNLAGLFASHQNVVARAALKWLKPTADARTERAAGDDVVRRRRRAG